MSANNSKKHDFNFNIASFFLKNTRLTILSVIFFVLIGVFTTLNLKITGFPSPEIGISLVQTTYVGADVDTITKKVTTPLEGAVKNVDGVKRFNSTSQNSFSNITVEFNEGVDLDIARSRLDSAVKSVVLPSESQSPKLITPEIGGPDMILVVYDKDLEKVYKTKTLLNSKLSSLQQISEVNELIKLNRQLVVSYNIAKLEASGISIAQVEAKIKTIGEVLPVASGVNIDNKNYSITTSLTNNSLEDLQKLSFQSPTGKAVLLSDVAEVKTEYNFENGIKSLFGVRKNDGSTVNSDSLVLQIKGVKGTDQNVLLKEVKKIINELDQDVVLTEAENVIENIDADKTNINIAFTSATANNEQIQEVINGLIGGKIENVGPIGYLGFLLGGMWLVMIVMIFTVSWRAAIISALAIPLSFLFSTIFLSVTGESLNTLTLFSLVLVTGLVVDPTLVVLESIQRKIDAGYKGIEAGLKGIEDVGMGIFLSMLTNIIVFVPFGVLSGVFGQIFRYIPYTIVPATIGSYIVPLIVLTWLGSKILVKNKHAKGDEADNLWWLSKQLINLNTKIINSKPIFRFLIIVFFLFVPLFVTGLLFVNGSVKFVQFAAVEDVKILSLSGTYLNSLPTEDRQQLTNKIIEKVVSKPEVESVFPQRKSLDYYIYLKDKNLRDKNSNQIAQELTSEINKEFGVEAEKDKRLLFDFKVSEEQTAGSSDFQTAISIESEDLAKLRTSSVSVATLIKDKACVQNNTVVLKGDCNEADKLVDVVDDGYSFKDNFVYNVKLSPDYLIINGLGALGRGPLTGSVYSKIADKIAVNRGESLNTILIDGQKSDIVMKPDASSKLSTTKELNEILTKLPNSNKNDVVLEETLPAATISRQGGKTTSLVSIRFKDKFASNQGYVSALNDEVAKYYAKNNNEKTKELGLEANTITPFLGGQAADGLKAFQQLGIALLLAIILSYIVLAVFFNSFLQPFTILYTIPITFIGVFPALAYFVGGQFGFLEIIGLIILVGIVENVAIFLIDGANSKVQEGMDPKTAMSYMSGVRFKPIFMTTLTTSASLLPLAIFSEFYRSIATVILGGLVASGAIALITTPILYSYFAWLSRCFKGAKAYNKVLFCFLFPIYMVIWSFTKTKE